MSVFCDWSGVVAYARTKWSVADDGRSLDRTWARADERSQFVSIAPVELDGLTWLTWSSPVGDDSDVKDARILDLAATEIGRIVRRDGNIWLEQSVPLATLTPSLLDWISESFASRADSLEQQISGRDDA